MNNPILEDIKKYFQNAKNILTTFKEEIDLNEYDFESIKENKGNFYICHKKDIHLSDNLFSKRLKILFDNEKGYSIITSVK